MLTYIDGGGGVGDDVGLVELLQISYRIFFPGPFLLIYSVFVFSFPYFFVSMPCTRLGWPSRQLLSARKYTILYCIVPVQR